MNTKLHIDVLQGIVNVEGEEAFVEKVYNDFMKKIDGKVLVPANEKIAPIDANYQHVAKLPVPKKAKKHNDAAGIKSADYSPQLDKNLDLLKLDNFYSQYSPKNHPEKILVFLKFLQTLGVDKFSADQVYTCYMRVKEKMPKAFIQAFRDAHGKTFGYINYVSPQEITLTIAGENHFNHGLTKK